MDHKEFSSRGGKARAKKLSKTKRAEIARNAAKAMWKKRKTKPVSRASKAQENQGFNKK